MHRTMLCPFSTALLGWQGTYPLADDLKLIAAGDKLSVLTVPKVIAAYKVQVLVPAWVWSLHGRALLIHCCKDDFIVNGFGGV